MLKDNILEAYGELGNFFWSVNFTKSTEVSPIYLHQIIRQICIQS